MPKFGIVRKGLTETVDITINFNSEVLTFGQEELEEWGEPHLRVEFFEISDEFVLQHLDAINNQKEFNRDYLEALWYTPFGSTTYPAVYVQEIDMAISLTDEEEEEEDEVMVVGILEEDEPTVVNPPSAVPLPESDSSTQGVPKVGNDGDMEMELLGKFIISFVVWYVYMCMYIYT